MTGATVSESQGPAFEPLTFHALPDKPLVSVLMSNYNRRELVRDAIESVLRQSYAHWELIVCDDGSTDGSAETVREYTRRDARVKLIEKSNGGQSSGFNAAYRLSKGQIVCQLDSDDLYLERKIEFVVEAFRKHPEVGMVAHAIARVDVKRRPRGSLPLLSRIPSGWFGEQMLHSGGILERLPPGLGLVIRREVAERIFPLREDGALRNYGDAPVMRLAPLICRIGAIEGPLAEWRQHGGNHGNTKHFTTEYIDRELRSYAGLWELQRDYLAAYHPQVAASLASFETHPHVVEMRYARARLSGSEQSRRLHRELMEKLKASHSGLARRLFWRLAARLPRGLFSKALDNVATQTRLKEWLWRARLLAAKVKRLARRWLAVISRAGASPGPSPCKES